MLNLRFNNSIEINMKRKICGILILVAMYLLASCTSSKVANTNQNVEETKKEEVAEAAEALKASDYVEGIANKNIDPTIYLDYEAGINAKVYKWIKSDDAKYYTFAYIDESGEPVKSAEAAINVGANNKESIDNGKSGNGPQGGRAEGGMPNAMPGGMMEMMRKNAEVLRGVYINANITNLNYQTMLIYAPAEYFDVDDSGNVISINYENTKNGYTAKTAPIVFLNECGGWRSSSPRSCETSYIDEGFVYVTCGARSRDAMNDDNTLHTGKAPMQMADLKSGVIELRANDKVIPGDKNKIISIGTSGGGQMSSIFGASGDMKEYYPYMYDAGTLGVTKNSDGTYDSVFKDNIFAAQNYCPIADIENADLAYAWWWVDLVDDGGIYNGEITAFEKRLQELEANAYIEYLNSLKLKDEAGNDLTLTGLRSGSYYDAILNNISEALNQYVLNGEFDVEETDDNKSWLTKDKDGNYVVTDLKGFMIGTGLVSKRNKAIPGFDAKDKSAENNAFGKPEDDTVHFSKSVATIMKNNYEELSRLDGFDKEQVDAYIEDALDGNDASLINNQTALLNATHILLGTDGLKAVNPVKHFRNRSGTADEHTSFGVGFNILTAARMKGIDVDYSLVWNMNHGSNEGTTTGTFIDWVNRICK